MSTEPMIEYPLTAADTKMLETNFVYHAPKPGQPAKYTRLRDQAGELAKLFLALCPPSRERSLALTKLEEAMMWVNAGIARNE